MVHYAHLCLAEPAAIVQKNSSTIVKSTCKPKVAAENSFVLENSTCISMTTLSVTLKNLIHDAENYRLSGSGARGDGLGELARSAFARVEQRS